MYMAHHQINYDYVDCERDAVLQYLRQAFKMEDETHARIMDAIQNMEVNEFESYFIKIHK